MAHANLTNSDLRDSDLSDANLDAANLLGAKLSGANLDGLRIEDARLFSVDFTEAENLTQDQIDSANGSKSNTILPPHLTAPDHWDD